MLCMCSLLIRTHVRLCVSVSVCTCAWLSHALYLLQSSDGFHLRGYTHMNMCHMHCRCHMFWVGSMCSSTEGHQQQQTCTMPWFGPPPLPPPLQRSTCKCVYVCVYVCVCVCCVLSFCVRVCVLCVCVWVCVLMWMLHYVIITTTIVMMMG